MLIYYALSEFRYHDSGGSTQLVYANDSSSYRRKCIGEFRERKDVAYKKYPIIRSKTIKLTGSIAKTINTL